MSSYFRKSSFLLILFICSTFVSLAQGDSTFNKKKFLLVVGGEVALVSTSLIALSTAWYPKYDQTKFHFFNDNAGWKYMDKFGHMTTSYYLGKTSFEAYQWAGVKNKKAIVYGGVFGLAGLTAVEILDGYSASWGFSWGDVIANTSGAALFIGQQFAWNEQRILLKWSYSKSGLAQYRPNQLGASWNERWLKDYNGQTYWFSVNINSFLKNKDSKIPNWFNLALGYGANGMIGSTFNPKELNGVILPTFNRTNEFYLSADIDFTKIKTERKGLKLLFKTINFIKVPFPALYYSTDKQFKVKALAF